VVTFLMSMTSRNYLPLMAVFSLENVKFGQHRVRWIRWVVDQKCAICQKVLTPLHALIFCLKIVLKHEDLSPVIMQVTKWGLVWLKWSLKKLWLLLHFLIHKTVWNKRHAYFPFTQMFVMTVISCLPDPPSILESFDGLCPPLRELLQLLPNFEQWMPSHPWIIYRFPTSLSESFKPFEDACGIDLHFHSFKHFVCFCDCLPKFWTKYDIYLWQRKNNLTQLAATDELTELECCFHWSMVFMTWTTETGYSLLMQTKPHAHKGVSPRTLLFYFWQYWVSSTN
jgi:hypothetical protein